MLWQEEKDIRFAPPCTEHQGPVNALSILAGCVRLAEGVIMPCSHQGLFIWLQILRSRLIQQKTGKHSCDASLWLVCLSSVCKTAAHVSTLFTKALDWLTNTLLHFQPPSGQFTGHTTGWFSFSQIPEDTLLSDFLIGFIPLLATNWADMSLFLHPPHSGTG